MWFFVRRSESNGLVERDGQVQTHLLVNTLVFYFARRNQFEVAAVFSNAELFFDRARR